MKKQYSRKAAEHTVCSAAFLCAAVLFTAAPSAYGQTSTVDGRPRLPQPDRIATIVETLDTIGPGTLAAALARDEASASDCDLGDDIACTRLVWRFNDMTLVAGRWDARSDETAAWQALTISYSDEWELSARQWESRGEAVDVEDLRIEQPGAPALYVRSAKIRSSDTGVEILLRGLTWREASTGSPELVTVMSARQATYQSERWRIVSLRMEPNGPDLGDIEGEKPSIQSGFLPPSVVHSSGDLTEFEAIAVRRSSALGRGVAGYVRGAPGNWYGTGLGIVGDYEPEPGEPALDHESPLATLGIAWKPGARPAVAAEGDAIFGETLNHAAVALETPGYDRAWRTQKIRRGAFFRDWSHSRGGLALHGEGHVLRTSASGTRVYSGIEAGRASGLSIGFGTEHDLTERVDLGLEVEHTSVEFAGQDRHVSSIRSDLLVRFGRPDRAFAEIGALGRLRARLVPTDVGFGAGTSGGLYATAETGLSFTGTFDGTRHLIRPSIFAVSEVVEFEKSAAEAISDGGDAPVGTTVADSSARPWHSVGIRLGQRVTTGSWQIDIPMEVFAATFGTPASLVDTLGASGGAVTSYMSQTGTEISLGAHLVCERACRSAAWDAGTSVSLSGWDFHYEVARSNGLALGIVDLLATHDTWSRILAFERPASSLRVSQRASIGWERRRFRLDVSGVTDMDDWGAAIEPSVSFERLGWGVGLTGFYSQFDAEWGLLAGLTTR